MLIEQILDFIHNHFVQSSTEGEFSIIDGVLQTTDLQPRQFFWINGSTFSNGVHQYGTTDRIKYGGFNVTETFHGTLSALAIPADLLDLAGEIQSYIDTNGGSMNSPFTSESFGGYSYTKGQGKGSASGADWRTVFLTFGLPILFEAIPVPSMM